MAKMKTPSLFTNISDKMQPVVTKSRRFNKDDQNFIESEISKFISDGIIEPCFSPWRAQVVIVKDLTKSNKKRLYIDYSQTVNLYTELGAYPLPRIDDIINKLRNCKVFSTFDLKSSYHQIPINYSDKKYTAFKANGKLFQFCRIPFGVTNGVSMFQRSLTNLLRKKNYMTLFHTCTI